MMVTLAPPWPTSDKVSAPFFEGIEVGNLLIQKCSDCNAVQLGKSYCEACGCENMSWIEASKKALVYSFTRIHIAYHEAFADLVPYSAGEIELVEGPKIFARIADDTNLAVGCQGHIQIRKFVGGTFELLFVPK